MNFFNFELAKDSYVEKTIKIPQKFAKKIPEDYLNFLRHYTNVEPAKMNDRICIKINGDDNSLIRTLMII